MIDSMINLINKVPPRFYADLLFDNIYITTIRKTISNEAVSVLPSTLGYAFRVFDGLQCHELADLNFNRLETRVDKLLQKIEHHNDLELLHYPKHSINKEFPMKKDILGISLDEKLGKVREIFKEMKNFDERVINPQVAYQDSMSERIFVNTEGSDLRQRIPRTRIFLMPVVKDGENMDYDYHIVNEEVGFEALDSITTETVEDIVKSSIDLANAPKAPSGAMPVILDSNMSGLIAHESLGHGAEADQVIRDRSYLKRHYKKKIANECVNISDSPKHTGSIGSYEFDDEGILAKKTPLIENGIFTHYLHTRLTASMLNEEPRGNGRRESFLCPVYSRMSNTYFEPGDNSMEELMEGVKEGVILIKGAFGMEDPLAGGMQVASKKGYLVRNGEKVGLIKGIALSGSVLDFISNIDAISDDKLELDGGTCGKGTEDYVPVTSGGTWLRSQRGIVSPN
ncbi:MAG: TldD/PmbA family protein [Promethearchaeota archaeon]